MAANEGITDADLQALLTQNVLAAEQLRRIIAERLVLELKAEKELHDSNGILGVEALNATEPIQA